MTMTKTRSAEPPIRGLIRVDPVSLFEEFDQQPEWSFDPHGTDSACRLMALHTGCTWDATRKAWMWHPEQGDARALMQVLGR